MECATDTIAVIEAPPERFLSVREFAARTNLSTATVYRLARAGRLPGATQIGSQWRVDGRRLFAMPERSTNDD